MRLTTLLVLGAFAGAVAATFFSSGNVQGGLFLLNVLLVAVAPVVIARSILQRGIVDVHAVLGAICIYVLIGMLWAFLDNAIGALGSEPFFVQTHEASTADYLYFSYVTQTTVGYGDFTAATGLGRALAVLEALVGQLYLVTVIALLVANLGRTRRDALTPSRSTADSRQTLRRNARMGQLASSAREFTRIRRCPNSSAGITRRTDIVVSKGLVRRWLSTAPATRPSRRS